MGVKTLNKLSDEREDFCYRICNMIVVVVLVSYYLVVGYTPHCVFVSFSQSLLLPWSLTLLFVALCFEQKFSLSVLPLSLWQYVSFSLFLSHCQIHSHNAIKLIYVAQQTILPYVLPSVYIYIVDVCTFICLLCPAFLI